MRGLKVSFVEFLSLIVAVLSLLSLLYVYSTCSSRMPSPTHNYPTPTSLLPVSHSPIKTNPETVIPSVIIDRPDARDFGAFAPDKAKERTNYNKWVKDQGLIDGLIKHVYKEGDTLADFGAGGGHYDLEFMKHGIQCFPFDAWEDVETVTKGFVKYFNLAVPRSLGRTFTWVMSLEVAEHIPPEYEETYLNNIQRHADHGVVISWATPGQPGDRHVNCLPQEIVVEKFNNLGFRFQPELTASVKAFCNLAHIKKNIMVFLKEK